MATTTTAKVGDAEIKLRCSALTPILYREAFRKDLFGELSKFQNAQGGEIPDGGVEAMLGVAYICAKQADPEIMPYEDWLDQFDLMASTELITAVYKLIANDQQTSSTAKKKSGQRSAK